MIFSVTTLIQHLSQFMVLSLGDVINTGTPQGVALSGRFPYLRAGDFMELEIDGLGRQRQELTTAQVWAVVRARPKLRRPAWSAAPTSGCVQPRQGPDRFWRPRPAP